MLPKYTPQTQSLPTSNIPTMAINPMVRMSAPPGMAPPVSVMPGHQPLMNVQVSAPGPRPLMGNMPGFPPHQQPLFNMPPRGPLPLLQHSQGPPINPAIRMQQGVLGAPPGSLFQQRMQMGGPRPR